MNKVLLWFSFVLITFFGCVSTSDKNEDPHFTSDAEELFFKNIRQSEYQKEENTAAGLNIFSHKEQSANDLLKIKLIHNWRNDKAFVLLEWNDDREKVELSSDSGEISWTGESMKNHHDVSSFIFNAFASGKTIRMNDSLKLDLTDANITTIKDYQRLISRK